MKKLDFELRRGNLGVRSCDDSLLTCNEHTRAEIIEWFDDRKTCYVIAYWQRDKEGYYLKFVGDRPMKSTVSPQDFFRLAKLGQDELDSFFSESKE